MKPRMLLALRLSKNDRWPQSWEIMNTRTRNPAANTARGTANHQETFRLKYIRYQRMPYGINVLASCQIPLPTAGFWYLATISFQAGPFVFSFLAGAEFSIIFLTLNFLRGR